MNTEISDAEVQELASAIQRAHDAGADVSFAPGGNARDTFCNVWPSARTALEMLKGLLDAVPGAGVFAKGAIATVIAAGDAAKKGLCGQ